MLQDLFTNLSIFNIEKDLTKNIKSEEILNEYSKFSKNTGFKIKYSLLLLPNY